MHLGRANLDPSCLGSTDTGAGQHPGQVLRPKARRAAPGTDVSDMNGPSGERRKRERGAKHLPAAFTLGGIYRKHHGSIVIGCR